MATINLNQIAADKEREMRKAFTDIVDGIKSAVIIKELADSIDAGDLEIVLLTLGIAEASFAPLQSAIQSSYSEGGTVGAKQVGRIPKGDISLAFRFDIRQPRAEQWLRENSSRLITEVNQDQKDMVRQRLTAALINGTNPRQSALDLVGRLNRVTRRREGGFIGMTSRQAEWVSSAREQLEGLDAGYFDRKLRDRRFDRTVKKAIRTNTPIPKDKIERMITALQARTIKYRGDVIARTESINALRAGQHESIVQAMTEGNVQETDVSRAWDATNDARTRRTHMFAEGQKVSGNQPFTVGGYQLRYPGDSSLGAPASITISCRCISRTTIDFGARVARIEGFG